MMESAISALVYSVQSYMSQDMIHLLSQIITYVGEHLTVQLLLTGLENI